MEKGEDGRPNMEPSDSYDTRQSRQRASVKWLLSKAFNNRVPENLREPFYRDHEDQEHLKPPIIGTLANAELYCLALSNMYSDPNYHNLNHWNILQTLARKGIHVPDPPDCSLTETVLIQTNPLKMNAHMAVTEGLMVLYGREVGTRDRVAASVTRWGGTAPSGGSTPGVPAHEQALLAWVASACQALRHQTQDSDSNIIPSLPAVESLRDLCDGVALAALISLYCPDALPASHIRAPRLASVHDSIHNLTLVQQFCQRHLPYNVFHMMPEDITYMRGSMHQNLLVMLADLFNVLEIHPAKCVRFPSAQSENSGVGASNMHGVVHKRCLPPAPPTPIPDLRSGLHTPPPSSHHPPFTVTRSPSASHMSRGRAPAPVLGSGMGGQRSACSTPERRSSSPQQSPFAHDEGFVVHRGRAVPTLSSVVRQTDERAIEGMAAGRPSNWEDQRRSSYAGRRSRRNSITAADDSQLTVENFGGSQDRLNFVGRNPEKELATVTSGHHTSPRKISAPSGPIEQSVAVRSTLQDAKGSIDMFYNDGDYVMHFPTKGEILRFSNKKTEELKEKYVDRQYSKPEEAERPIEQSVAVRSTLKDARGTIDMFLSDGNNVMHFPNKKAEEPREKIMDRQYSKPEEAEKIIENQYQLMNRQLSNDAVSNNQNNSKGTGDVTGFFLNNNTKDSVDGDISSSKMASFADLTKFRSNGEHSGIQLVYMQHGKEENPSQGNKINRFGAASGDNKMTSFGMMPNTTTWQQQCLQNEQHPSNGDVGQSPQEMSPMNNGNAMTAQINNIRLKLEEKRRRIEHEKKRMEMAYNRQRQQLGQQAFLQAVSKNKGSVVKSPAGEGGGGGGAGDEAAALEVVPPALPSKPERPVSLQDISSEAQSVENKWMDQDGLPFVETRRTPDLDGMGIEDYHQSIAKMNSSLQDIQTDIARLASQQNQIQANHVVQQQVYQPAHIPQSMHNQYGSQHNVSTATYGLQHSNFGSSPHIPHDHQQIMSSSPRGHQMEPSQFYLHERPQQQQLQQQPTPPPRRTWAQQAQINNMDNTERVWQSPQSMQFQPQQPQQPQYQDMSPQRGWAPQTANPTHPQDPRTWSNMQGFILHENSNQPYQIHSNSPRYQNGTEHSNQNTNHLSYTVSSPQAQPPHLAVQSLFTQNTPPSASPQHRSKTPQRQQSLGDLSHQQGAVSLQQLSAASTHHVPIKAPTVDDMEPQNISFIGNAEDEALQQGIGRLNITSGNRTYRLPSPTRPSLTRNSFQQPLLETNNVGADTTSLDQVEQTNEKGFYISFDSEQPKRPKPPLRMKRGSPKKDRTPSNNHSPERDAQENSGDDQWHERVRQPQQQQEYESPIVQRHHPVDNMTPIIHRDSHSQSPRNVDGPAAIIIGNDLSNPAPETAEEMERKKERIMLLSLQRRQAAEEARARSEAAAEARRQREASVAEERAARKEQQAQRRDQILQQYKLKKAIEEAEREGKVFDKAELMSLMKPSGPQGGKGSTATLGGGGGGGARLRPKAGGTGTGAGGGARARPKTIHVDSGAVQMAEGMLLASRGKQGSSSNLTAGYSQPASSQSTMRRDYYRGSQDSLADRAGLYRDSPIDESRGMSPGSGPSVLGRRGSYKTSRENVSALEPQTLTRGRSKYSTYQNNFKTGRKSSSLMNLCDSGLGRATPPRRAPSPGLRTLPSPSGPGSLPPGLVTKRRNFDDGSSDISSTPSSIMDYSGPRLYKQPATKSNRGIMLNAVEYCVFPGAVNKEAKRRVLEEINSSESKHFLVLFRDAGCQFRALYSFCPDRDEVYKLYGTGPRQVNDRMFDKFFKYNSGSKCFSQIHTKHLTVTIDAFTIHNSLWQGKKVQLPSKKDMALVI